MRKLIVFLYFVFLFKLAFAQSLPSIPNFDEEEKKTENIEIAQIDPQVPSLDDFEYDETAGMPDEFDIPSFSSDEAVPTQNSEKIIENKIEEIAELTDPTEVNLISENDASKKAEIIADEFDSLPDPLDFENQQQIVAPEIPELPTLKNPNIAKVPSFDSLDSNELPNDLDANESQALDVTAPVMPTTPELPNVPKFEENFPETPTLEKKIKAPAEPQVKIDEPKKANIGMDQEIDNLLNQVFADERTEEESIREQQEIYEIEATLEQERNIKQIDSIPVEEEITDVDNLPITPIEDLAYEDNLLEINSKNNSALPESMQSVDREVFKKKSSSASTTYGEQQLANLLVAAAMKGDRNSTIELLRTGRSANAQNKFGESPLMGAIFNGHNEIAEILLNEGANVNILDKKGNTALLVAAAKNNISGMQLLIKNGADLDIANQQSDTPLVISSLNNNLNAVDLLLREGANVNKPNSSGLTALHIAAHRENAEIAKYLISFGANVNAISQGGLRPIDLAKNRNSNIYKILAQNTIQQIQPLVASRISNEVKSRTSKPLIRAQQIQDELVVYPSAYIEQEKKIQEIQQTPRSNWWAAKNINLPVERSTKAQNPNRNLPQKISVNQVQVPEFENFADVNNKNIPASLAIKNHSIKFSKTPTKFVAKNNTVKIQQPLMKNQNIQNQKWHKTTLNNSSKNANIVQNSKVVESEKIIKPASLRITQPPKNLSKTKTTYSASNEDYKPVFPFSAPTIPNKELTVERGNTPKDLNKNNKKFYATANQLPQSSNIYKAPKQVATSYTAPKLVKPRIQTPITKSKISNPRIPNYRDLTNSQQAVWDSKLKGWVQKGFGISSKQVSEQQKWKKQKQLLEAVYKDLFNAKVQVIKSEVTGSYYGKVSSVSNSNYNNSSSYYTN